MKHETDGTHGDTHKSTDTGKTDGRHGVDKTDTEEADTSHGTDDIIGTDETDAVHDGTV